VKCETGDWDSGRSVVKWCAAFMVSHNKTKRLSAFPASNDINSALKIFWQI
jgi:hypothetical protein